MVRTPLHSHSTPGLGSFESGGSSGSRSPGVLLGASALTSIRGLGSTVNSHGALGSTLSPRGAFGSSMSPHGTLGRSMSPRGFGSDAKSELPAAVAVTVLQPVLPEDQTPGQPLLGLLSDQADQAVRITSWPALRLPFRVYQGTVLTLQLFRPDGKKMRFGTPARANDELGNFVAGIQIPVGVLLGRGTSVQCWCALKTDLGAYSVGPRESLEAFESLRHQATYDVDTPKAFIALRPLRPDQVPPSPSSARSSSAGLPQQGKTSARCLLVGSPTTSLGNEVARLNAYAHEHQMDGTASPRSGAFGTPLSPRTFGLSPSTLGLSGAGGNGQERELSLLRVELQAERSRREAEVDNMSQSMSELYQMLEVETAAASKCQEDEEKERLEQQVEQLTCKENELKQQLQQKDDELGFVITANDEAEYICSELRTAASLASTRHAEQLLSAEAASQQRPQLLVGKECSSDQHAEELCAEEAECSELRTAASLASTRHAEQLRSAEATSQQLLASKERDSDQHAEQLRASEATAAELLAELHIATEAARQTASDGNALQQQVGALQTGIASLTEALNHEKNLANAEARQAQNEAEALIKQQESPPGNATTTGNSLQQQQQQQEHVDVLQTEVASLKEANEEAEHICSELRFASSLASSRHAEQLLSAEDASQQRLQLLVGSSDQHAEQLCAEEELRTAASLASARLAEQLRSAEATSQQLLASKERDSDQHAEQLRASEATAAELLAELHIATEAARQTASDGNALQQQQQVDALQTEVASLSEALNQEKNLANAETRQAQNEAEALIKLNATTTGNALQQQQVDALQTEVASLSEALNQEKNLANAEARLAQNEAEALLKQQESPLTLATLMATQIGNALQQQVDELQTEVASLSEALNQEKNLANAEARQAQTEAEALMEQQESHGNATTIGNALQQQQQVDVLHTEVASLSDALKQEKNLANAEARQARNEAEALIEQQDEGSSITKKLRDELQASEEAVFIAEDQLSHRARLEAQNLVDELKQQEAASRQDFVEEFDGARDQFLSSIEVHLQTLEAELAAERDHHSYHTSHGTRLEGHLEELQQDFEARDQQLEVSWAELKDAQNEFEEHKKASAQDAAQLQSALQREVALSEELQQLEQRVGQERSMRELSQDHLKESQRELQKELQAAIEARANDSTSMLVDATRQTEECQDEAMSPRASTASAAALGFAQRLPRTALRQESGARERRSVCFGGEIESPHAVTPEAPLSPNGQEQKGSADESGGDTKNGEGDEAGGARQAPKAASPKSGVALSLTDAQPTKDMQSPSGSTSEPTVLLSPAAVVPLAAVALPTQWTVEIDRSQGDPLGINLSSETLTIDAISDGGLFSAWNAANPTKAVHVGDRILDVNGQQTINLIIKECQEPQMLHIKLISQATSLDLGSKAGRGTAVPAEASNLRRPNADSRQVRAVPDSVTRAPSKARVSPAAELRTRAETAGFGRAAPNGDRPQQRERDSATQRQRLRPAAATALSDSTIASPAKDGRPDEAPSPAPSAESSSGKDSRNVARKPAVGKQAGNPEKRATASFHSSLRG